MSFIEKKLDLDFDEKRILEYKIFWNDLNFTKKFNNDGNFYISFWFSRDWEKTYKF